MKQRKLFYIGFSFKHHGKYSGYDCIKNYGGYDVKIDCQRSHEFLLTVLNTRGVRKIYRRIFGTKLWWIELYLIFLSQLNRNKYVFHIIYGENIFYNLGKFKRNNKVVLTLHQPLEFFIKNYNFLKKLVYVDKIIAMSEELNDFLIAKGLDSVFVPHGVETSYFKPGQTKKPNSVLMIGSWLRDFEFANKIFEKLLTLDADTSITVVTSHENDSYFSDNRIQLLHKISDHQLLLLYQESIVLFLPLTKFTANNSLLEAMACGCKVIIATNSNNSNSYLLNNNPILIGKNLTKVTETLMNAFKSGEENKTFQEVKENYSWEKVGLLTNNLLKSVTKIITNNR